MAGAPRPKKVVTIKYTECPQCGTCSKDDRCPKCNTRTTKHSGQRLE